MEGIWVCLENRTREEKQIESFTPHVMSPWMGKGLVIFKREDQSSDFPGFMWQSGLEACVCDLSSEGQREVYYGALLVSQPSQKGEIQAQ